MAYSIFDAARALYGSDIYGAKIPTKQPSVLFTKKSCNSKVGPIPVSTTSAETCPDACPLKRNGCYADTGPLGMIWSALSKANPGEAFKRGRNMLQSLTWSQFVEAVSALPEGTLWRHNQAGDLPGVNNAIDHRAPTDLVIANMGKRGFTYTHKPLTSENAASIAFANRNGFTINLSADNLAEADELKASGIGPVVTLLDASVNGNAQITTPKGTRVVVCPATYRDDINCASCKLCSHALRETIVGFPAHGTSKKKASAIANS
jgi:hypothetical protein